MDVPLDAILQGVGQVTVIPVLVAFVWIVIKGGLVPRSTVNLLIGHYNRAAERDHEVIDKQSRQITALLESAKTQVALMQALKVAAGIDDAEEDAHPPTSERLTRSQS